MPTACHPSPCDTCGITSECFLVHYSAYCRQHDVVHRAPRILHTAVVQDIAVVPAASRHAQKHFLSLCLLQRKTRWSECDAGTQSRSKNSGSDLLFRVPANPNCSINSASCNAAICRGLLNGILRLVFCWPGHCVSQHLRLFASRGFIPRNCQQHSLKKWRQFMGTVANG